MLFKRLIFLFTSSSIAFSDPSILINQIGYEQYASKSAIIDLDGESESYDSFQIIDNKNSVVFSNTVNKAQSVNGWNKGPYIVCDFSKFILSGTFSIRCGELISDTFSISESILMKRTFSDAVSFFKGMRSADDDSQIQLFGSTDTKRNVNGGWNDATGDRGKYLSHLAYSNFFTPQQIPMVIWSLLKCSETKALSAEQKTAITEEAVWGADYLIRILDPDGFFYMIVFDRWGWDKSRDICTWIFDPSIPEEHLRNGQKTADYQTAFREGGGIAIAALAKAAKNNINSASTKTYLDAAKLAYNHLKSNNKNYCDDKTENIIDQYCALLAAVELFRASADNTYLNDAHIRASNLMDLISDDGFLWSDADHTRPYYHAAEEGLPVVALLEYLDVAPEKKSQVSQAVKKIWTGYQNRSFDDNNPFSYIKLVYSESSGAGVVGKNLALNKPVTASQVQSGFSGEKLCDGVVGQDSRWASGQPYHDTEWVIIDLESEFEISSVVCNWEAAYGKEYDIQVSNDKTNWKNAVSITNDSPGRKVHSFDPVSGRYVRMFGKLRGIEYGYSLFEFEVYGKQETSQEVKVAYFMPHSNETGYWWQGENARLASLTSAAYLSYLSGISVPENILSASNSHLDWIMGKNPFGVCMVFGHGYVNYPDYPGKPGYTLSNITGGVCNGITADTNGADSPQWKPYEDSNTENWRWIEQWLPHNAWYILAASLQGTIDWKNKIPVYKPRNSEKINLKFNYRISGEKLLVSFSDAYSEKKIILSNISGQVIQKRVLNSDFAQLPLARLSKGLYIMNVSDSKNSKSFPVMISR